MKHIYVSLALAILCTAACQKIEYESKSASDADKAEEKAILRSMLSGRDTRWTEDELALPSVNDGWQEIRTANQLATLLEFGCADGGRYRLMNDINVASSSIAEKFSGEIGIEQFCDFEFDGNGYTISGMDLPLAAGLFSIVKGAVVKNLNISGCTFGSEDNVSNLNGTGALFGVSSGNVSVTDVNISECNISAPCKVGGFVGSVTDGCSVFTRCAVSDTDVKTLYFKGVSGWCGGFVGFVGKSEEKNGNISVSMTADACSVNRGSVKAHMESDTRYSGTFLGTLNGHDYNEVFSMNNCTVSTTFEGLDPKASSYVSIFPDRKVGGHKYMEGYVYLDGLNYVVPWDGTTKTQPAVVDGAYHVYTADELAWFQGKTVTEKILIHRDIDLAGKTYAPIYRADYIDGQKADGSNCEIRNLKVVRTNCEKEDGGAFIRQASGTTVHKNITFRNADIKATHDPDADHGNAYCATLCGNMTGTYTMDNVHAYDGKLYGVNKMGGLLGRVYATATITDCSVSGYHIENYEVNDKPELFEKEVDLVFTTVSVKATFYPQGEVGGMVGFIQAAANISRCKVYETKIKATGQKDNTDYYVFTIPGRHIGTVIGDIRTSKAEHVVTISECSADSETEAFAKQTWLDQQSGAPFIGKCYAVPILDTKGSVTVDGKELTL